MTCSPPSLRRPGEAPAYAQRAVDSSGGGSPEPLLVLAAARLAAGDHAGARAVTKSAYELLPYAAAGRTAEVLLAEAMSNVTRLGQGPIVPQYR